MSATIFATRCREDPITRHRLRGGTAGVLDRKDSKSAQDLVREDLRKIEREIEIKILTLDLGNKLHHQFDKEFFLFLIFSPKESNPSSFYIPSFIGALMHMTHVRVQKSMCAIWRSCVTCGT